MSISTSKKQPPASLIFIFGGSGDLAYRKLIPALYNLYADEWMPQQYAVVGIGRTDYTDEKYREHLLEGIKEFSRRQDDGNGLWKNFSQNISYLNLDLAADGAYEKISAIINQYTEQWAVKPNILFYLAVAPQLVPDIARELGKFDLCDDKKCTRIVIEKPFGHDLKSAHELNAQLQQLFDEDQIYRIDHYLGKETVQNILALRFANALFEPLWNRNYIDHIQITVAEKVGVEGRGGYYEQSGALRDMVQNHILQLLCMVAMEAPVSFDANEIRNKKTDVLNAIRKISTDEVQEYAVRGQYGAGWMEGTQEKGYREEEKVDKNSAVETYAAVKFLIDNWRWQGVPFYVRTGKYMQEKISAVTVQFKPAPHYAFPPEAAETWRPNRLIINIQPQEEIRLRFQAKRPGQSMTLNPVDMVFKYDDAYDEHQPEAYETLLLDAIEGNATQFMRADQVEAAWRVVMPIIEAWEKRPPVDFPNYQPGTWGPEDADALIARDGHNWIKVTDMKKE